jgi:hypothetical protein
VQIFPYGNIYVGGDINTVKEFFMNKKQKLFLGFAVIVMAVIFTMTGCASLGGLFNSPEFPSGLNGTWERAYESPYTNTININSRIFKDSTQDYYWIVERVSGDDYTLRGSGSDYTFTIRVRLENDYLVFGEDNTTGEHDWAGTWKRK